MKQRKKFLSILLTVGMLVSSLHIPTMTIYAEELSEENTLDIAVSESIVSEEQEEALQTKETQQTDVAETQKEVLKEEVLEETSLDEDSVVQADENEEVSDAFEETSEVEKSEETDDVQSKTKEIMLEISRDGIYQFGGAPSKDDSGEVSFSKVYNSAKALESAQADELAIEEYLYQEMLKRNPEIDISKYNIAYNNDAAAEMNRMIYGVINDNPDLYFVTPKQYWGNNIIFTRISVKYDDTLDDAAFKKGTRAALSVINNDMSELEKAIALHDYLTVNCEYDYENYLAGISKIPETSYSAYGVLVERTAVCQGYALTYKYLLNQVGIECYMVNSSAMNHAWNLIKLDGEYYQVDVTWDDPAWDLIGRACHQNMFRSDDAFVSECKHHDWSVTKGGEVVDYKATDTRYDEAFWTDVRSPLVLSEDNCYYVKYDEDKNTGRIYQTTLTDVSDGGEGICDVGLWHVWGSKANYLSAYSGLFEYHNRLYYNDQSSIWSVAFDGTDKREEFTPDTTNGYIYGSVLCQGKVLYSLHQSPSLTEKETVLTANITIEIEPEDIPVESVTLNKSTAALIVGETVELQATVAPDDATDASVSWESSNPAVATVEDGIVTAVAAGDCVITVSAGEKSAVCNVTVTEASEPYITARKEKTTYECGDTLNVDDLTVQYYDETGTATTVTNYSTNASTIDMTTAGQKTLVVTYNGLTAEVELTVTEKRPESEPYITARKEKTAYECGDTLNVDDLTVQYYDETGTATTVTGYSTNASTIDMTTAGGKKLVVTYNGLTAEVELIVTEKKQENDGKNDGLKIELAYPNASYVYTGSAVTPQIIVTNNGAALCEGTDYTVKYANNVKVTETAKITVTGKGNLTGSTTREFRIVPKRLDDKDVVPAGQSIAKVEGNIVAVAEGAKVSPTLLYGGTALTAKDFKFADEQYKTYKWKETDNDKTITVTGQGNFTGSRTLTVKVIPKAQQSLCKLIVTVDNEAKKLVYNGKPQDIGKYISVSTKGMQSGLKEGEDYIISYPDDMTSAGTKKFTVAGISTRCMGTVTKSCTVKPKKVEFSVEYDKQKKGYLFVSTGSIVSDLVVKDGSTKLQEGKDYKVSYSGNKKVGTAKFTVTGLGSYKGSSYKGTYTIYAASLNNNPSNQTGVTKGLQVVVGDMTFNKAGVYKSVPYVSINGEQLKKSDYTVSYYLDNPVGNADARVMDNKENKVTNANGDTTVWVKIEGKDKGNYAAADGTCYVTASYKVRNKAENDGYDLSKAKVTFTDSNGTALKQVEYTGNPITDKEVKAVVTYKTPKGTITLQEGKHYTVEFVNNVNKGTATVVINGKEEQSQYVGSKTATFKIAANNLKYLKR